MPLSLDSVTLFLRRTAVCRLGSTAPPQHPPCLEGHKRTRHQLFRTRLLPVVRLPHLSRLHNESSARAVWNVRDQGRAQPLVRIDQNPRTRVIDIPGVLINREWNTLEISKGMTWECVHAVGFIQSGHFQRHRSHRKLQVYQSVGFNDDPFGPDSLDGTFS